MILIKSFINSRNIDIRIDDENQSHNIDVFMLMLLTLLKINLKEQLSL